jgi:hypothetical protein
LARAASNYDSIRAEEYLGEVSQSSLFAMGFPRDDSYLSEVTRGTWVVEAYKFKDEHGRTVVRLESAQGTAGCMDILFYISGGDSRFRRVEERTFSEAAICRQSFALVRLADRVYAVSYDSGKLDRAWLFNLKASKKVCDYKRR